MSLIFWCAVLSLIAGGLITGATRLGWFDTSYGAKSVTNKELGIGAALCLLLVVPTTIFLGNKIALSNNLTYKEFWSGYETEALKEVRTCKRDGNCAYEYDCDPYEVAVTKTRSVSDGKGGTRTETYTDYETRYHRCPYATEEWRHAVNTTLGGYYIETTFSDNPQQFRGHKGLKGGVRHGSPPQWLEVQARIAAGNPGGVTKRMSYNNYILASQSSILKEFSGAVEKYGDLIPAPAKDVHDHYFADKAYFVGVPADPNWTNAVQQFNAAFGSDLQGDLHVVLVDDKLVENPDEFTGAVNADWTSKRHGKNALSKNGLVLVLGVSSDNVEWARGFTGMPLGNEGLLTKIRNFKDMPLNPNEILGTPRGVIESPEKVTVENSDGALESLVWDETPFKRVCMTCKEEGGGGFDYLGGEIQPNSGQKTVMMVVVFFLSLMVWGVFAATGTDAGRGKRVSVRRSGYRH